MLACAMGAVLSGVGSTLVNVEVDLANGLPCFNLVGLPDTSVSESRDRVRSAIAHSGQPFPMCRITVNLAPSDVPKSGPTLDLAVAIGLLVAQERCPASGLDGRLFFGELALSGQVRPVRGALAAAEAARVRGLNEVVCPAANAAEAALAGLPVRAVETLADAVAVVRGAGPLPTVNDPSALLASVAVDGPDLNQIRDQDRARRALEIAAAGGHNLLLSGPPGSGKTMLARALPSILPPMVLDEALEVTRIHSAAGCLPAGRAMVSNRPFRAPHHGVSQAGMVGGGSGWIRPGEVTLAHRGVLFLDEFPEFPRGVLEALRQPLEDGTVTVIRSRMAVTYPARFMLVAAMNPCPCGDLGTDRVCRCTPHARNSYSQRLSGPLLDRIDLHVNVGRVDTEKLLDSGSGEPSDIVRKRVEAARAIAGEDALRKRVSSNAEIPPRALLRVCNLDGKASAMLARASGRLRLSARSVHRILRVSRTIADLEESAGVRTDNLLEALTYRIEDAQRQAS